MKIKQSNLIQPGSRLSTEQIDSITAVIAMIIPASEDGRMPGADELNLITDIINEQDGSLENILDDINHLNETSQLQYSQAFADLESSVKQQIVDEVKLVRPDYMQVLAAKTAVYYYQHDRVLEALGLELRPPFPKGNIVHGGDLSLLDPVRQRKPMYRE